MDTRLIFRDFHAFRWSDGGNKRKYFIGLVLLAREVFAMQIRRTDLIQTSFVGKTLFVRGQGICVKSLPRKTSKNKSMGTVPQTDTGSQVEKTKANE